MNGFVYDYIFYGSMHWLQRGEQFFCVYYILLRKALVVSE